MTRTATCLALLALLALTVPASAQVDVTGKWTIEIASPDGTVQQHPIELTQDGSDVTGSVPNPMAGVTETAEGTIEGSTLIFVVDYEMNGQPITIEVKAEIDGDAMTGTITMADFGSIPFTGKRDEG